MREGGEVGADEIYACVCGQRTECYIADVQDVLFQFQNASTNTLISVDIEDMDI